MFTILSALSLLLCVAVVVVWVRSYWVEDYVSYGRRGIGTWAAWSRSGRICFWSDRYEASVAAAGVVSRRPVGWNVSATPVGIAERWPDGSDGMLGFAYETGGLYTQAAVSWWALAVTSGSAAAALGISGARRTRRRRGLGRCAACGYDLRATPDQCPECGAVPAKASA